jgi:tRNA acetyltransferase TAN1
MCGINYPIISNLSYSGLLTAFINKDKRRIISKIKKILDEDPTFFQYILKIVPIDYVCDTDIKMIKGIVNKYYKDYINPNESFMIALKRRKNEIIERDSFIRKIAAGINNQVDLSNPDKIIWIEVLGNKCGISFIEASDIITINYK